MKVGAHHDLGMDGNSRAHRVDHLGHPLVKPGKSFLVEQHEIVDVRAGCKFGRGNRNVFKPLVVRAPGGVQVSDVAMFRSQPLGPRLLRRAASRQVGANRFIAQTETMQRRVVFDPGNDGAQRLLDHAARLGGVHAVLEEAPVAVLQPRPLCVSPVGKIVRTKQQVHAHVGSCRAVADIEKLADGAKHNLVFSRQNAARSEFDLDEVAAVTGELLNVVPHLAEMSVAHKKNGALLGAPIGKPARGNERWSVDTDGRGLIARHDKALFLSVQDGPGGAELALGHLLQKGHRIPSAIRKSTFQVLFDPRNEIVENSQRHSRVGAYAALVQCFDRGAEPIAQAPDLVQTRPDSRGRNDMEYAAILDQHLVVPVHDSDGYAQVRVRRVADVHIGLDAQAGLSGGGHRFGALGNPAPGRGRDGYANPRFGRRLRNPDVGLQTEYAGRERKAVRWPAARRPGRSNNVPAPRDRFRRGQSNFHTRPAAVALGHPRCGLFALFQSNIIYPNALRRALRDNHQWENLFLRLGLKRRYDSLPRPVRVRHFAAHPPTIPATDPGDPRILGAHICG